MKLAFRTLTADEIEVRVARVTSSGVMLLLYKNARCDMQILDETVGAMNWRREHSRDNANCTVSIWDEDRKMWVDKEDVGTESNTEAQKGLASDSFKRACVNWGIGRELYTSPNLFVPAARVNMDGGKCRDSFSVEKITYDEKRRINGLSIINASGNRVIVWHA